MIVDGENLGDILIEEGRAGRKLKTGVNDEKNETLDSSLAFVISIVPC